MTVNSVIAIILFYYERIPNSATLWPVMQKWLRIGRYCPRQKC